jgi:N-acetylglucosaminyldiphosphoundecaprenol N-acetyl-beta-D-mannosaminyltransferase
MAIRNANYLLGLFFDSVGLGDAIGFIEEACDATGPPKCVATVNIDYVVKSLSDRRFREALLDADLCCPDGMPIIWIMTLLGISHKGKVSGSDLLPSLMGRRHGGEHTAFIFGSREENVRAATERINESGGSLRVVGYRCPPVASAEELSGAGYIREINGSGADIVLLSLDSAKAMRWITANRGKLKAKVICQVGAAVDFLADSPPRAPLWMQELSLEWLWRLIHDPHLAGRYGGNAFHLFRLLLLRILPYKIFLMKMGRCASGTSLEFRAKEDGGKTMIYASGTMVAGNLDKVRPILDEAASAAGDVVLDFGGLKYIDSASLGALALFSGTVRCRGGEVSFTAKSGAFDRIAGYLMFTL